MSYGLKYTANFKDIKAVHTYTVNLYQKDYTGAAINVRWYDMKPAKMSYRAANKEDDIVIQGSEFQFSFVAYRQKDTAEGGKLSDFQDLLIADYREFILQFKKGANVRWVGYVQPDRVSRNLLGEIIHINISATDALKDLDSYKYRKKIVPGEGISSLIRNISNALDYTGLPTGVAPLDFRINMDTYHNEGTAEAPALLDTYVRYERFISDGDYDSCFDVIKKIIKPFCARLRQASGKYWIQKDGDSNAYKVEKSNLDNFSVGTAPAQVDISGFKYRPYGELSYISPVGELRINRRNRFMGGSVTAINQNDWVNNWTIDSFPTGHISYEPTGALTLHVDQYNQDVSPVMDQFEITEVTQDDAFIIRLQHEALRQHIMPGAGVNAADEAVSFRAFVTTPDGSTLQPPSSEFVRATYTSLPYEVYLSMPEKTGMYQVGIQVISRRDDGASGNYDGLIQFSDFKITRQTVDQETTFDRQYVIKNSKGRRVVEKDFFFEDSKDSDIGSFLYKSGGNYFPTSKWNNDLPIVELFAKNYMSAAAKYNEWIKVEVQDPGDVINPENTIVINGKVYFIWGYEKDYYRASVILSLKQSTYTADSYDEHEIDFPFVRPRPPVRPDIKPGVKYHQDTKPTDAVKGDHWLRTTDMRLFQYMGFTDAATGPSGPESEYYYWIEISSPPIRGD